MAHSRVAFAVAVTLERLPLLPLVARNVERVAAQCGSAAVVIVRDHEATDAKVARAWRRGAPQAATGVHVLAQRPCAQGEQRAGRMEKIAAVRNTYWDFLFSTGFNESHRGWTLWWRWTRTCAASGRPLGLLPPSECRRRGPRCSPTASRRRARAPATGSPTTSRCRSGQARPCRGYAATASPPHRRSVGATR